MVRSTISQINTTITLPISGELTVKNIKMKQRNNIFILKFVKLNIGFVKIIPMFNDFSRTECQVDCSIQ